MNKYLGPVFFLTAFFSFHIAIAQKDSIHTLKTYRVGIFAPLYLDSVFSIEGKFRYKDGMPKFIMPGIDFVNGAQIALDSIKLQNDEVHAIIYDTKSYSMPVAKLISYNKIDTLDLIIGSVKDIDYKQLADFALSKNIPFISATYPNDGGVSLNPFLVVVNSTLKAHCEALFSYLLQNHGTDNIYLVRKKGTQEDKIAGYFKMLNEQDGNSLLKIQTINVDSTVSSAYLKNKLDSNMLSVIIGASLDESFAASLTAASYDLLQSYAITLLGMPNWDGFKSLMKKEQFADFPVYVTTPYFNSKSDDFSKILNNGYTKKYKAKPTDMVFKGFECTYLFTKLLTTYPGDMMNHINDKDFKVFCDYNFRPVMLRKENTLPDYFENKHLYFIKIMNGTISKAW